MQIIIDPYRGGEDTGTNINSNYEKNILLDLSKDMSNLLKNKNINTSLTRNNDVSLTEEERNNIINTLKNNEDIIIQNRYNNSEFNIIYPLRSNDNLPKLISNNLEKNNITLDNYYQKRLPGDTAKDYYSIIRNTSPNETLIIEYKDLENYQNILPIIVNSIYEYLVKDNIYTVKKGDNLYSIAKKYNITVDKLKKDNNLSTNNLSIGQNLYISKEENKEDAIIDNDNIYTIKKGDTLYSIAKKYNITVSELKSLNNLNNNILEIGANLKIPESKANTYTVKKGDTLYSIAKKYNITVSKLKELNNLNSNILTIGEALKIS